MPRSNTSITEVLSFWYCFSAYSTFLCSSSSSEVIDRLGSLKIEGKIVVNSDSDSWFFFYKRLGSRITTCIMESEKSSKRSSFT